MGIRAKFRVVKVAKVIGGYEVDLQGVTSGSPENENFFKYTPNAQIHLAIVNEPAAQAFGEPGDEFYAEFTKAGVPVA